MYITVSLAFRTVQFHTPDVAVLARLVALAAPSILVDLAALCPAYCGQAFEQLEKRTHDGRTRH